MFAASGSSSVRLPDFARTTTFRSTLAIAGAFVLCTGLLFGFFYGRTAAYMTSSFDALITGELHIFAAEPPERWLPHINERLDNDPRRVRIAGLFGADGHRIAGNLENLPGGLTPDVPPDAVVVRLDNQPGCLTTDVPVAAVVVCTVGVGRETEKVRLATECLPDGEILAIGRN